VTLAKAGLLPVVIFAAWAQAPSEILTIDEALELAERYNPQLKAATAFVDQQSAGITTARAYPNPEFTTGFGRQQITQLSNVNGQLGVFSLSQPIETGNLREARIRAATLGRESAQYTLSENRLAVRTGVKQTFYEALRREQEVDLVRDDLRLLEDLRRRIQVQVDVGEAARLELTRADAELAAARIRVRSTDLRYSTAVAALRAAIGAPLRDFRPSGAPETPPLLPPLDRLRQEVLERHPSLGQVQTEIRRGEARLDLERELVKPQPVFRTDLERQPDAYLLRIGVVVPIPLWNRRQGQIAEATAAVRQANAIAEQRRVEITAALERAYGQYQVATEQLAAFEAGALKEAEAALQAAEAAFRYGERGIIEVLDAQRVLRSVRLDYLNAQYDRQAALIELEQLRAIDLRSGRP